MSRANAVISEGKSAVQGVYTPGWVSVCFGVSLSDQQVRASLGQPAYQILRTTKRPVPKEITKQAIVEGPLLFLDHDINRVRVDPDEVIRIRTFWRAVEDSDRSLSLMAHLMGPDEIPIAHGDGLSLPVEQW